MTENDPEDLRQPGTALAEVAKRPFESGILEALGAQAEASFQAAREKSTLRAYAHDWREFDRWCSGHRLPSLPAAPQTVILYSTDLTKNQGRKWNTLSRRLAALSQLHQRAGFESPTRSWPVREFLAGLRREIGVAPERKKPVLPDQLREIVEQIPSTRLGTRDRALLLLGFAGAFRRSELVALDVASLEPTREGLVVTIRRSKTDQEGQGRKVGIPRGADPATCPIRAVEAWRAAGGIESGALFRGMNRHDQVLEDRLSAEAVALVVEAVYWEARLRPKELRRAQPARRVGDFGCGSGQERARHHEPDRPPQRRHSPPLHSRRQPVPRECGGWSRLMITGASAF